MYSRVETEMKQKRLVLNIMQSLNEYIELENKYINGIQKEYDLTMDSNRFRGALENLDQLKDYIKEIERDMMDTRSERYKELEERE